MKPLKFLKGLLFLLIIVLSVPLTIVEEIIKFIFSLKSKIKLNKNYHGTITGYNFKNK